MSFGANDENGNGKRLDHRVRGDSDSTNDDLPMFDVVVILPDGREAAKVGGDYFLLKRGKPDFNQPVNPEDMKA